VGRSYVVPPLPRAGPGEWLKRAVRYFELPVEVVIEHATGETVTRWHGRNIDGEHVVVYEEDIEQGGMAAVKSVLTVRGKLWKNLE
jgi:hypothetical protein